MVDIIYGISVVILSLLAVGFITYYFLLMVSEKKSKMGYKNHIIEPLKKALDNRQIKNLGDIYSVIRHSEVKPYSDNPDKYVEQVLDDLKTYKLTTTKYGYSYDSVLFENLWREFEAKNEEKPFEALPNEERDLMLDILDLIKDNESSSSRVKQKMNALSKLLSAKERNIQTLGVENKVAFRLSKVSLYVGVISMILTIISLLRDFITN